MFGSTKILTFLALCGLVTAQNRQNSYGNSDSVRSGVSNQRKKNGGPRMSLELARKINSIASVEEFLKVIDTSSMQSTVSIANRFGGVERSFGIVAKPALCMPELQTVPLDTDNNDSSIFYFPSCTRVKRCGGCCESLFSCQPKETITKNYEVIVSQLTSDGDIIGIERKIIPVEEHARCECNCKLKSSDCHIKQIYVKENCECKCMNTDEEDKCDRNSDIKYWDPVTCSCHCWKQQMCNIGWIFNPDTCRCDRQQTDLGNRRKTDYSNIENSKSPDSFPELTPPDINSRRRSNKDDPEYK